MSAANSLRSASEHLGDTIVGKRYSQFGTIVEAASRLLSWRQAILNAELDADRYLKSAQLIARELSKQLAGDSGGSKMASVANQIVEMENVDEVIPMARSLLSIPLPLPMFTGPASGAAGAVPDLGPRKKPPAVAVAFASFLIDGVQFSQSHTIQPQVMHDLAVEIQVSRWPDSAEELVLEPVSVEPRSSFELPTFSFGRPSGDPPHAFSGSGRMVLQWPQKFFARPLEFTYRARFNPHPDGVELIIQGQRYLRAQCYDPNVDPQSGYAGVDQKLIALRAGARALPAIPDVDLNDFLIFLAAVGNIAGQALQDNVFPRVYSESEFQDEIKRLLRRSPRIGSQLEEHPAAGGGFTDLSFRRIRIELKARSDRPLVVDDADRFLQQTAQYAVGSDKRFALLALLDCSPKAEAPGPVANDIVLRIVPPPTGGILPICVGVVIIRGNLAKPSTLSKKNKRV